MNAQQFFKSHRGGESWERVNAIRSMHQAAYDQIKRETGSDTITINGEVIVDLWDMLLNYYSDDGQPLSRVELNIDGAKRDWQKKLLAVASHYRANGKRAQTQAAEEQSNVQS